MNTPAPLPQWPSHPKRSRIRGWIWKTLGVLSFAMILLWPVVFLTAGWMEPRDVQDIPPGWPMFFFGLIGVKCYMRGKRHFAIAATELLAKDPRPPVIYLRSFQHDKKGSGSAAGSRLWGGWAALFDLKTVEERLAEALTPIGPVIAIGKPGEKLPALGAARLYVGDDEWQDTIRILMSRAKLVVLLLGDTPGFWWELERSVSDLPPERLVLIVPFRKKRYERFRERARDHFPHALPDFGSPAGWLAPLVLIGISLAASAPFGANAMFGAAAIAGFVSLLFRPRRGLGKLGGLIYFRRDWTSEWVDLTKIKPAKGFRLNFYGHHRMHKSLNWNMRPVFGQLRLEWKPPKVRRGYLALGAAAASIIAVALVGMAIVAVPGWGESRERDRHRDAFVTRIREYPSVVGRYGALNPDQAEMKGRELARAGILRLDDGRVMERQSMLGEMWASSTQRCIAPLMQAGDPDPTHADLSHTPVDKVWAWYELLKDAAIAETDGVRPVRIPTDDEVAAAFAEYDKRYTPNESREAMFVVRERTAAPGVKRFLEVIRFGDPFGFYVQVQEATICSVFGELNLKAATLPPPHNANLARALAAALR